MEEVELNITDLIEEGKMVLDLVQDSFESQRKVLLDRLLSIENPELNHEMLEFLLYPQNCQDLLNIMCASNRGNRFTREDAGRNHINIKITDEENNKKDADPDLVKAYRALYLLTRNESSPPLAIFIEKKGFELGACIFKMFEENSGASFWHVFEILTFLLRNRCKCVHEAMLAGGYSSFASRFDTILKNLRGLGKITDENIEHTSREIRKALLEADVNFHVAKEFVNNVKDYNSWYRGWIELTALLSSFFLTFCWAASSN